MAYISTLLDSPAVVSLVDGKLLAEGAGGGGGGGGTLQSTEFYTRWLHPAVQPRTHL